MKITATQYAKSLYAATKEKSQSEIDIILQNFVKILAKNNHFKFKEKIIQKFREIHNQENGIVEAQVTSCKKLDENLRDKVSKYLRNKYDAKDIVLDNKVDEKIKGGIIVQVGDEILNASVARQLANLNMQLAK